MRHCQETTSFSLVTFLRSYKELTPGGVGRNVARASRYEVRPQHISVEHQDCSAQVLVAPSAE